MPDFTKYHFVIQDRIHNPNAQYDADYWWDKEIRLYTKDIKATINFITSECTDEELFWIGEIFDDLIENTNSVELYNCLCSRIELVSNPIWKDDLRDNLKNAFMYLE